MSAPELCYFENFIGEYCTLAKGHDGLHSCEMIERAAPAPATATTPSLRQTPIAELLARGAAIREEIARRTANATAGNEPVEPSPSGVDPSTLAALDEIRRDASFQLSEQGWATWNTLYDRLSRSSLSGTGEDTARLDWLEANEYDLIAPMSVPEFTQKTPWTVVGHSPDPETIEPPNWEAANARKAIDAARVSESATPNQLGKP